MKKLMKYMVVLTVSFLIFSTWRLWPWLRTITNPWEKKADIWPPTW